MLRALPFIIVGLGLSPDALAGNSMFRLVGVKPHARGAEVRLSIIHDGGSRDVEIFVSNTPQKCYSSPEGACLGWKKLPGGMHNLVLDYNATKLEPGKPLYMTMRWKGGHLWGLAGGEYARPANSLMLPPPGAQGSGGSIKDAAPVGERSINVNKATAAQLARIPGIDQKMAQAIVDYRGKGHRFSSTFALTKVSGIERPQAAMIAPYIKLKGESQIVGHQNSRTRCFRPVPAGWSPRRLRARKGPSRAFRGGPRSGLRSLRSR